MIFTSFYNFRYRGGVDCEGRPVMVVVGAHFLLRCLDLERFVLYVIKVLWSLWQKTVRFTESLCSDVCRIF